MIHSGGVWISFCLSDLIRVCETKHLTNQEADRLPPYKWSHFHRRLIHLRRLRNIIQNELCAHSLLPMWPFCSGLCHSSTQPSEEDFHKSTWLVSAEGRERDHRVSGRDLYGKPCVYLLVALDINPFIHSSVCVFGLTSSTLCCTSSTNDHTSNTFG